MTNTKLFSSTATAVQSTETESPKLAEISITTASGGTDVFTLPVISISEFSHHSRQQIDSSLDGTVHVLSAYGGLGTCHITFMDRVQDCRGGKSFYKSALAEYGNLRTSPDKNRVVVKLLDADGATPVATFTGVVKTCTATATTRGGIDAMLVTYVLQGVMSHG